MEYLALEIFDLTGTGSQFATLPDDTSISITVTSEIFASGDVWSHNFTLNVYANAHIFGTSGEIHGSRLHEQINKRKARLWVEGLPLYLGYLKLDDEVEVDGEGNVDVSFESGQKTFEEMIEGTKAREVSVGDVVIGVALNRKRVSNEHIAQTVFTLDGLEAYTIKDDSLGNIHKYPFKLGVPLTGQTPYVQRWPKLVKSSGLVYDEAGDGQTLDYTNVQTPYDEGHAFCNINICYPLKVWDNNEEKAGRGYTLRLAHGKDTTDGGDGQTRFNNAPNFYLLHFVNRLFKDLKIHIEENQAKDVEDLRRVFMLNFGCHYEEIEDEYSNSELNSHTTPTDKLARYGQYYIPIISDDDKLSLVKGWAGAGQYTFGDAKGLEYAGKVLLRDVNISKDGVNILTLGSIEGHVLAILNSGSGGLKGALQLDKTELEYQHNAYSSYLAYATGDNYPNVEISEIIKAMEAAFGVRLIFSSDYKKVRIVLLRNIFRSAEVQNIVCDITGIPSKTENCIRGFRMTYGKGTEDTSYYYKGFNDLFPRASKTWKDTSDTHDYSQWKLDAEYDLIKQDVSAFNKTCYVTPVNGNAYGIKVDEEEDVLFPSLFEMATFIDAEDGDCSGDEETINTIDVGVSPVTMNEVQNTYAVLFPGELKAPAPEIKGSTDREIDDSWKVNQKWLSTYGRVTMASLPQELTVSDVNITGNLDVFISEGFRIRLLDNYSISNGGTPFDEANPGLCFGIMRSSGSDAYISYQEDTIGDEGNDWWEAVPGKGAIDHPDTCDSYGDLWDYNGAERISVSDAAAKLAELWPSNMRNAPFKTDGLGYINGAAIFYLTDNNGERHNALLVTSYSVVGRTMYPVELATYPEYLSGGSIEEMMARDRAGMGAVSNLIVEIDSSQERCGTLLKLCQWAWGHHRSNYMTLDNGIGSTFGRFSLKLRAEKPNPYFDASQEESAANRRYLEITNPDLRGRGLADQFYKEYSKFVREARIIEIPVRMELAQLLAIDKTVRVTVGDVTGFISKMTYSISKASGLGIVTLRIMYI